MSSCVQVPQRCPADTPECRYRGCEATSLHIRWEIIAAVSMKSRAVLLILHSNLVTKPQVLAGFTIQV